MISCGAAPLAIGSSGVTAAATSRGRLERCREHLVVPRDVVQRVLLDAPLQHHQVLVLLIEHL